MIKLNKTGETKMVEELGVVDRVARVDMLLNELEEHVDWFLEHGAKLDDNLNEVNMSFVAVYDSKCGICKRLSKLILKAFRSS